MADTGLQVRLDMPVEDLPVGERQRLEILKALFRGARILILDEPTAVLTPQETEALFVTLRRLRDAGTTLLLITHKLKEIMALCDAVTVMRQGTVVFDGPIADCSLDQLAEAMVGRRVQLGPEAREAGSTRPAAGATLLAAHDLQWRDALGVPRLAGVSLSLRAGEIVGIAGVSGNGQSELLALLSGMAAAHGGTLALGDAQFTPGHWLDPATARRLGLAHVPEDRHRCGLVLPFAAWETAVLGYQRSARFAGGGWMKRAAMRAATARMMEAYDVRPRNVALRASKFSGGNQQKLVLAREALAAGQPPRVLLVGQPTRGVDIGAIEFIHGRLRAMRDAGGAVLLVSSELDEILALADRVLVMDRGRFAGELAIAQCTEAALGRLMAGAQEGATR
jgi:simple sugar transport system ATP-binding protein